MSDLVKLALNPAVMAGMTRSLKGFGSGAGMGGAIGGVLGAGIGAAQGYGKAKDEGGSGVGGALSGAWGGAGKGLLLGAAAGGAVGAVRPAYAQALAQHMPRSSNFGQRQVHALTGVADQEPGYLRSIGGGAADAEHRLHAARAARESAGPGMSAGAQEELEQATKGFHASAASERQGLYSIPGYAKALARDPVRTLKTGINDQWQNMGTGGRALMYGLPAAGVAQELAREPTEDDHNQGRLERAGRLAGSAASGMLAPLAIGGDIAVGGALQAGLGRLGRVGDKFVHQRRRRPEATSSSAPEPAGGTTQPESREFSDRAAGAVPEGFSQ